MDRYLRYRDMRCFIIYDTDLREGLPGEADTNLQAQMSRLAGYGDTSEVTIIKRILMALSVSQKKYRKRQGQESDPGPSGP